MGIEGLLFIPKGIANIGPVRLEVNGDTVTGCLATFEVNGGTRGAQYQGDVWDDLTPEAKQAAQVLRDAIKAVGEGLVTEARTQATDFTK